MTTNYVWCKNREQRVHFHVCIKKCNRCTSFFRYERKAKYDILCGLIALVGKQLTFDLEGDIA